MGFMDKFSIKLIISEHLKTFKKADGDYIIKDLLVLLSFPLFFTIVSVFIFNKGLHADIIDYLSTVFIALAIFFFALLPSFFSLTENKRVSSSGRILLKEFKANVLFTILLSFVFSIVLLFCFSGYCGFWLSFVAYFLFAEVILHFCLIIQRFNILMDSFIGL